MDQQIISNKVYESLQEPTVIMPTTTGKILYANRFSGIQPVPMPQDLKNLIDSDFGLVGKNLLIQLEQKMKGYDNGPWYIDSRDGIIYIHNRKFKEDPVAEYIYQGGHGEVLKITFNHQAITKQKKINISSLLRPDTKDLLINTTNIDDDYIPEYDRDRAALKAERERRMEFKSPPIPINNTHVNSTGFEDYIGYQYNWQAEHPEFGPAKPTWDNIYEDKVTTRKANEKKERDYKLFHSKGPKASKQAALDETLDSMGNEELATEINKFMNSLPDDKKGAADHLLHNFKNPKELETELYKILKNAIYLFKNKEYYTEEWINPQKWDPQSGHVQYEFTNCSLIEAQASLNRGVDAVRNDPRVTILEEKEDSSIWYGTPTPGKRIKGKKMKIAWYKPSTIGVPLYKMWQNLWSRYGGVDKLGWALKANANGGLKSTEKKLVVHMTVVGRPSLQSSQIIKVSNIGKKWSGYYYIKKCTHTMDAGQGYLTQLELTPNKKDGYSNSNVDTSTQPILQQEAKLNGKTDWGKDKKPQPGAKRDVNVSWNYNEKLWMLASGIVNEHGDILDAYEYGQALRKKLYHTEVNAKNPRELAEGIILSNQAVYTSEGQSYTFGKPTIKDIKVPDDYQINFNWRKVAYNTRKNRERRELEEKKSKNGWW